jgi:uncharacterized protein (DUF488 family)
MRNDPPANETRVLSVGHSHHDLPHLIELLRGAGVEAVADVRSSPFSRRLPQFNQPELERGLKAAGVAYVFLGDLLGGRPRQGELYDDEGRVDYRLVRATDFFRRGLERLERASAKYRVAMLCAEEDPLDCHRGLMIAPALVERGIRPGHLRGDGRVETTAALEDRLLAATGLDGLFALAEEDRREALAEAYVVMARKKAFRLRPEEGSQDERTEGE